MLLEKLLAEDGDNPVLLAQMAFVLLRQGLTELAQALLEKLEKNDPGSVRTLALSRRRS